MSSDELEMGLSRLLDAVFKIHRISNSRCMCVSISQPPFRPLPISKVYKRGSFAVKQEIDRVIYAYFQGFYSPRGT